ncbi:MAG: ABC transporter ATP-binding protein [Bacilli bacterium]
MISKFSDAVKKYLPAFIFGPALKMIEAVFDLMIPLIMKTVIDLSFSNETGVLTSSLGRLIKSCGTWVGSSLFLNYALIGGTFILIMGVLGFATTMVTQYIAAKTAVNVGTLVRNSLYQKILSFSKKDMESFSVNKLLTILNSDSYQAQQGVLFFIRLIVRAPFIIIGALVISFILSWQIGLVFLAMTPIIIIIVFVVMARASKEYLVIQGKLDHISNVTSDDIEGSKVVRAFNRIEHENEAFAFSSKDYQDSAIHVSKLNSLINPLSFAVVSVATIFIVLIAGFDMSSGNIEPTTIISEVSYLDQIFITTIQLTNIIMIFTKSMVSIKRIDSVLALNPSVCDDGQGQKRDIPEGEEILSFQDVSLGYKDSGNLALKNISFSLNKGQSLGIIGGTGSGKSTLIKLIERFYDATKGKIIYKGEDIRSYPLHSLRDEIGYVPQKSVLFKGTLKTNMQMAKADATEDEITSALKQSQAYDFVAKYDNYLDYEVEEGGKNFSGGQKQRLSIARALLKQPELLILDDSTSALDLLTDKKVRTNISTDFPQMSKVIVSQRVSTIENCDLILVLEAGELIGMGNHAELLQNCEVYRETFESQTKKEA